MFVSGSQDKTARFWDLRASSAISVVPSPAPGETLTHITLSHLGAATSVPGLSNSTSSSQLSSNMTVTIQLV